MALLASFGLEAARGTSAGQAFRRRAAARGDRARVWPMRRRCCWPTNPPAISMSRPRQWCSRNCCAMVRRENVAALIATHNPDLAARMDRTVTLREGRVAAL